MTNFTRPLRLLLVSFAVAGLAGAVLVPAGAQSPNLEDQIVRSLRPPATQQKPRGLTRSLSRPDDSKTRSLVNKLRGQTARAITIEERQQVVELAKEKPKIDLEINFDYNSWTIGPQAMPSLIALGNALSKDEFKGTVFFINGYTDAAGGDEYNQQLSERRAEAVKRTLIERYYLPPNTLIAVGYGKTHLKNPGYPYAAENRRVQIVNTQIK